MKNEKGTMIRVSEGLRREIKILAAKRDMTFEELLWKAILAYKKFGNELG